MNFKSLAGNFIVFSVASLLWSQKIPAQEVPGQFIVTLKQAAAPPAEISAMASGIGGAKVSSLSSTENTVLISVNPKDSNALKSLRSALAKSDRIVAFEPNRYIRPCATPNDPKFAEQSYLNVIGAPAAWDKTTGSADVLVAVIDSGIQLDHEDLKGNFWVNPSPASSTRPATLPADEPYYPEDSVGWNFAGNKNDLSPQLFPVVSFPSIPALGQDAVLDPNHQAFETHGSHVAGLIGAIGNNGIGGCGVAWSVKLMPLKVLDGPEDLGTVGDALLAINYAVAHKARIINISWGLSDYSAELFSAIARANSAGILVVVAAGNNGEDLNNGHYFYPACFKLPNLICVAATNNKDQLIDQSNYGANTVDVGAPGEAIMSTVPLWDGVTSRPQSGYAALTGTSMATALVTGEAALLMSKYPSLSVSEVRQIILRTCDRLAGQSAEKVQNGRINLGRALGTLPLPDSVSLRLESVSPTQAASIQNALTDEKRAHLFVLGNAAMAGGGNVTKNNPGVANQDLLVRLKQGKSIEDLRKSIEDSGGKLLQNKPIGGGLYQLQVEGPGSGIQMLEAIRGDKNVVDVEKNQSIHPEDQP
ncbi:MAG: S8 family serine peptidase [Planctomycetota bacterium]|nr:S8 family serine peptidase [Planctomycetota bacterium]